MTEASTRGQPPSVRQHEQSARFLLLNKSWERLSSPYFLCCLMRGLFTTPCLLYTMCRLRKEAPPVAKKEIYDKLSIYIPQPKMAQKPVERLIKLSEKRDRSINYLVVEAIIEYLKREEGK